MDKNEIGDLLLNNAPVVSEDYEDDNRILFDHLCDLNQKNIGIVGPLGCGKSSLVLSFRDNINKLAKENRKKSSFAHEGCRISNHRSFFL